jgi:hypothetical protein
VFVAVAIHQGEAPPPRRAGVGGNICSDICSLIATPRARLGRDKNEAHRRGRMCFLHKYLSSISVQKLSVNQWCNLAQTNKQRMHLIEPRFWYANHRLFPKLFLARPVAALNILPLRLPKLLAGGDGSKLTLQRLLVSTYRAFVRLFYFQAIMR